MLRLVTQRIVMGNIGWGFGYSFVVYIRNKPVRIASWSKQTFQNILEYQKNSPVKIGTKDNKSYWYFHNLVYWTYDELSMEDLKLLLLEIERKKLLKIENARKNLNEEFDGNYNNDDEFDDNKSNNDELEALVSSLRNILYKALKIDHRIKFDDLRILEIFPELELPDELKRTPKFITKEEYLSKVPKPSSLEKIFQVTYKYNQLLQKAEKLYSDYERKFKEHLIARHNKIEKISDDYNKNKRDFDLVLQKKNNEIDEIEKGYIEGDPDSINKYYSIVLENSEYPEGFPQEFRLAYLPEPKELVVDYELPTRNIVPEVAEYRYIKSRNNIEETPRKAKEIKEFYQDIVSSICLRCLFELFDADRGTYLDVIVFNGFVQALDPATGKEIRPYIISIRTTFDEFKEINLEHVDKRICLRSLGAQMSPQPDELIAIKPILEFDMVDKRFIEDGDVLSELESRPNIMDLDPYEFENLVNNLFSKIGFEAKLTRSSRDGGVDVIAFDPRPILGGKVVIQAKRYKNVVGVSAVRDLYGSMINEGASKGILVTTSHYGAAAYSFGKNKPIELIDGSGLLYLLNQNGIKAKIIFPIE